MWRGGCIIRSKFLNNIKEAFVRNPELESVFKSIPEDKYFLETDMIEETIEQVYPKAAKYKNTTVTDIQQQVEKNWKTVFGKQI